MSCSQEASAVPAVPAQAAPAAQPVPSDQSAAASPEEALLALQGVVQELRELHCETSCEVDCCGAERMCAECGIQGVWPCETRRIIDQL